MPGALEWLDLSWAEMGGVVHDDVISVLLFLLVLTEGSTNFPRPFVPKISAYGTFQWCRYRKNVLFHENGLLILKNNFFSKCLLFHVELWYLPREKIVPGSTAPFPCFRPPYSPLLVVFYFHFSNYIKAGTFGTVSKIRSQYRSIYHLRWSAFLHTMYAKKHFSWGDNYKN